jgi:hypothetical protein
MAPSMKPEVLTKLHDASDFLDLTKAVLAMCEPFGAVHAFRFVHNRRAGRVACFIELESPKHHGALMRALGAKGVGEEVCLDIPVREGFDEPCRAVSLAARGAMDSRRPASPSAHAPQVS